jgi:hypothetical protein
MKYIEHPENTFLNLAYVTKAIYTPSSSHTRRATPYEIQEGSEQSDGVTEVVVSLLKLEFHRDCGIDKLTLKGPDADRVVGILRESSLCG